MRKYLVYYAFAWVIMTGLFLAGLAAILLVASIVVWQLPTMSMTLFLVRLVMLISAICCFSFLSSTHGATFKLAIDESLKWK